MAEKPIKLFHSLLTNRVFASRAYKVLEGDKYLITGNKYDVTEQFDAIARQRGYLKGGAE